MRQTPRCSAVAASMAIFTIRPDRIHDTAGPDLLAECRTLGGCLTGQAKITRGYNLRARWVIHTVGPIWRGGGMGEDRLLAECYRNSVGLARQAGCLTLAFPAISTGVYRFPADLAARIATATLTACAEGLEVTLVAFDHEAEHQLRSALAQSR
jgi:O-acetyl-ADP-ribose deacetylase